MLFFLLSNNQHFPAVVALICLFLVRQIEITVYKQQQLLEECTACREQQRLDSHLKTPTFVWFAIVCHIDISLNIGFVSFFFLLFFLCLFHLHKDETSYNTLFIKYMQGCHHRPF